MTKSASTNTDKKAIISMNNVSQQFAVGDTEVTILKDISFDLYEKSFNIIYGPSGSGKSTLLNVLSGLQNPTKGKVQVLGHDIYSLSPDSLAYFRSNEIGIVYQQNYWVKSLSVVENVSLPLYFSGYSRKTATKHANETLEMIGMGGYAKKHPSLLSGGEQQRIALVRALINSPKLIIADEPTGSLDSKNGEMVINLLRKFQQDLGRTIILVTHNMEYLPYADHLLNIHDGEVTHVTDKAGIQKTASSLLDDVKKRISTIQNESSDV